MNKVLSPVMSIQNLKVWRSKKFSLNIENLELRRGSVVCITGSNGSGKTTMLETVAGLISKFEGKLEFYGKPIRGQDIKLKRLIGYVPDDDNWLIPELTAQEYFFLLDSVYHEVGVRTDLRLRATKLAEKLNFQNLHAPMGDLSHGNRKKVQIIAGMIHAPRLLIIDEIRNGLDPIAIIQAESLLKEYVMCGASILAATHDLWWAQRIANEIVMLSNGKVIFNEKTDQIIRENGSVETKFLQLFQATA